MLPDNLPKDPAILLSYLNTKLRDEYPTLADLCEDMHIDIDQLTDEMAQMGFEYSHKYNKFR